MAPKTGGSKNHSGSHDQRFQELQQCLQTDTPRIDPTQLERRELWGLGKSEVREEWKWADKDNSELLWALQQGSSLMKIAFLGDYPASYV